MAKRLHDTTIWKNQRWFKKLSATYKLAFLYLCDQCDHAGFWKIDFSEMVDDLGLDDFNIDDFVKSCNKDFDKKTGKPILKERVKIIENQSVIWITKFIQFQYESKDFTINPLVPVVKSAITLLNSYKILGEALNKGYLTLPEHYSKAMERTKDKDKDKDKDILYLIYSNNSKDSESLRDNNTGKKNFKKNEEQPQAIKIGNVTHEPKKNGVGWIYPTIIGKEFSDDGKKVLLTDGTWQELGLTQKNMVKGHNIQPNEICKGKIK